MARGPFVPLQHSIWIWCFPSSEFRHGKTRAILNGIITRVRFPSAAPKLTEPPQTRIGITVVVIGMLFCALAREGADAVALARVGSVHCSTRERR
jgi:hypothetical protein